MINILITSASRKVNLVQTFRTALEKIGGQVVAVDTNLLSPALYLADHYQCVPSSDDPRFIADLIILCKAFKITAIVPTRDEELLLFSKHQDVFDKENIKLIVSAHEKILICQDKALFHRFCLKNAFKVPHLYDANSVESYPVFIKPRVGKGSSGLCVAKDSSQLETFVHQNPDCLIQDYIDAPEYTVDVFADFSGQIISAIPRQRVKVISGESYITRTENNPFIISETCQMVSSLGLIGHITVQCFLKNDQVIFIEINPRFGGAAHLGFVAGANTPDYIIRLLQGEILTPHIGVFQDNITMLRFTEDLFLDNTLSLINQ